MHLQGRSASLTSQMICQLISANGKQIAFQWSATVIVRKADQKPDKCLLDNILTAGSISNPAICERNQPSFVAINKILPRVRISLSNTFNEVAVCFLFDGSIGLRFIVVGHIFKLTSMEATSQTHSQIYPPPQTNIGKTKQKRRNAIKSGLHFSSHREAGLPNNQGAATPPESKLHVRSSPNP